MARTKSCKIKIVLLPAIRFLFWTEGFGLKHLCIQHFGYRAFQEVAKTLEINLQIHILIYASYHTVK